MQRRFATAESNNACTEFSKFVDTAQHGGGRDWRRVFVELVAIGAGEIAAPDGNHLGQDRVICRGHGFSEHTRFPPAPPQLQQFPHSAITLRECDTIFSLEESVVNLPTKLMIVPRALLTIVSAAATILAQPPQTPPVYQDASASPERTAADLVSRMTLEEKVGQMQ